VLPANNRDYVVIGNRDDTLAAKGWPGHDVLDRPDWTPDINWDWVRAAIARRAIVYLATTPSDEAFYAANGTKRIFATEYEMFIAAGYKPSGDFLIPPLPTGW
jgi:hypothetical protein